MYGRCTRQQEQPGNSNIANIFFVVVVFNETIIPLALVGYEILFKTNNGNAIPEF